MYIYIHSTIAAIVPALAHFRCIYDSSFEGQEAVNGIACKAQSATICGNFVTDQHYAVGACLPTSGTVK